MVVEAVISSLVQLLGGVLLDKVNFIRGVEEQVQLLKDELIRMQCFLKDAGKKQAHDENVRLWISEIREVAHDARDSIEMFVNKLERKGRLGMLSEYPKHLHYINKAGKEIAAIQKRLEGIHRSRELYGIRDLGAGDGAEVESRRRLAPWKNDEVMVGMEDDVGNLLREGVLDERKGVSTAVVEGMGGIGKSTLARKIYNHLEVVARFGRCRGWVVVSSEYKVEEMMKQLILQLPRSDEDKKKLRELERSTKDVNYLQEKLQEMLHKLLKGKEYFIVLDDVWEMEHWKSLRTVFPGEPDKASRILITTRNKCIAKQAQYALEMQVLDINKSWELFLKKAQIPTGECPEELEQIGREIVHKCNGLPLAISAVGGLLAESQTITGWEEVLNKIDSHLGRAESSISTILELSYQNLSPLLKSCFLCLTYFKEDASIPAKTIIHIWLGQGLVQQEGRRTVEEIARGYLDELINRNMIQIKDLTLDGRVKNCHLHDLVRDLCLGKAKEEIGFSILKGEEGTAFESSYKTRHCVVRGKKISTLSLNQNDHLRSLFVLDVHGGFGDYMSVPFRFWKRFQLLEILYLDGIGFESFPHSFRSLIGLKYLRIRCGSDEPLQLPGWLDQLTKLEILDTRTESVKLPRSELKMDRLRYFNARHVQGLRSINDWTNIETLKYIGVDDFMRCSLRLNDSCRVRQLGMFLDGSREADLKRVRASIEKMKNLVKLQLMWDMPLSIEPTVIPRINNLTRLKLRGGMKRCPDASMFPPSLSHLTLEESFLNEDVMAELGKLPKLLYLELSDYAYLGETMKVLHDGFPCLTALSLRELYFLIRIEVESGGLPRLKQLRIHNCPALETRNLPEHIMVSVA